MVDRTHREFIDDDNSRIAETYLAWRTGREAFGYADALGFCKSVTRDEVREHGHVPTPRRYVGVESQQDDGEPF